MTADYVASTDYLKVFISRLRAKIEQPGGPRYIATQRRLGYPGRPDRGGRGHSVSRRRRG